ncbi:MAG: methyl-accepting chemotaxis protein [Lachnospiraceae bacterium]|nr:methyl-accepting chemotaxis protein [Lachnospiraceae bacterium]
MLLVILPIVIIVANVIALVSGLLAQNAILEQTSRYMNAELAKNANDVDAKLESVRMTAEELSIFVGNTYKTTDMASYAKLFGDTVRSNDLILGSGIWFEPSVYTGDKKYAGEKYVGPYWYRDGDNIVEDWEYSNAEYDYFSQEYYTNAAKITTLNATITDPYYDPASDSVMASCSAPIFNEEGSYIGCITVDMSLGTISDIIGSIKVGTNDNAILLTSGGAYIYTKDQEKVESGMDIASDKDSISQIASTVLSGEKGETSYKGSQGQMNVYYTTIPEVNWKLIIEMPLSEIKAPAMNMTRTTVPICIIGVIVSVILVFLFARSIANPVKKVDEFAVELSKGNFSVAPLDISRNDEIGEMSESLNEMYGNNSGIIKKISTEATNISDASSTLGAMSEELAAEFSRIQSNVSAVNEAMMNSSAATEEVSASVTEVNTSVQQLASSSSEIKKEAKEISSRARQVQEDSRKAYESAISIAKERETEIKAATAKAEVVNEIKNMADAISNIASEIDLLSLNASIEAARAGEAGRGFAVVAQQINKLATDTAAAVKQIQDTVSDIQGAFSDLSEGSNKLLSFVTDTVTPDYDKFTGIGKQYGDDANLFDDFSARILEMANSIKSTMDEVNYAVQNIAESTQDTAAHSSDVNDSIGSVSNAIESVAQLATDQQSTARELAEIVDNFKF